MSRKDHQLHEVFVSELDEWWAEGRADALAWKPPSPANSSDGPMYYMDWAYQAGHRCGVRERTEMEKRRREVLGCPCDGKKAGK